MSKTYFHHPYVSDLVQHLAERSDVELIQYDDLDFGSDIDYVNAYPDEYARWKKDRDKNKIQVLFQYDVDTQPERTDALLRIHESFGVPASVMLFVEPAEGRGLLYHALLPRVRRLMDSGLCSVGYHCNAYERANFQKDAAHELFCSDVKALSSKYDVDIQFWSPHGGDRSPEDQTNAHVMETPLPMKSRLRWVHNKYTVRFDAQYSDGGLACPTYSVDRNLQSFVAKMVPGKRYRILLHPQYYWLKPEPCATLAGFGWYNKVMKSEGKVW